MPIKQRKVGIADSAVVTDETHLVTSGLGSCIGIALHDPKAGVSGLLHAMLPTAADARGSKTAKFVETGVPDLIDRMQSRGADPTRLRAWIAGGSQMLEFSGGDNSIGARNVRMTKRVLSARSIPIEGADVGGDRGRSLRFRPDGPGLVVRTAAEEPRML
ncbi:MAG: chemotaxis protein CheD [Halobacteriota archaeon]